MIVHNYDIETKEYLGSTHKARLPAYATLIAPPTKLEKNKRAIFNENYQQWEKIEDHRGTIVYDKNTKEEWIWERLGPIPNEYTKIKPPLSLPERYTFQEEKNIWEKKEASLEEEKQSLHLELLKKLNTPLNEVDNPILTCILLANVRNDNLPLEISKNNLSEIETISNQNEATTKEAELRESLLNRYKKTISFAKRLRQTSTKSELQALSQEIESTF